MRSLLLLALALFALFSLARAQDDAPDAGAAAPAEPEANALPADADAAEIDADPDIEVEEAAEKPPAPLTPEEQERQQLLQEAFIRFLKKGTSPECNAELMANMENPDPEQQHFSPECNEEMKKLNDAFKEKLMRAQKAGRDPLAAVGAVKKKAPSEKKPKAKGVKVRRVAVSDERSVIVNVLAIFGVSIVSLVTFLCLRPRCRAGAPAVKVE